MKRQEVIALLARQADESAKMAKQALKNDDLTTARFEKGYEMGLRTSVKYIQSYL